MGVLTDEAPPAPSLRTRGGGALDIPDEDIDCLAECVSQYDTCGEVVAGCDNEEPGTPCYAL